MSGICINALVFLFLSLLCLPYVFSGASIGPFAKNTWPSSSVSDGNTRNVAFGSM